MIPDYIVEELTNRISKSVDRVLISKEKGNVETEPSFTDRLLANIERDFDENSLDQHTRSNVRLTARTLRDRGRKAPESIFGADLVTVLSVSLENYKINKGFLAQSKSVKGAAINCSSVVQTTYSNGQFYYNDYLDLSNPGINEVKNGTIEFDMVIGECKRMQMQCKQMLSVSPDSFVFLYGSEDVYVVPAVAIVGKQETGRVKYHCKNLKSFFTEYLRCFIGDSRLDGTKDDDFEKLMNETGSPNLLFMQISSNT